MGGYEVVFEFQNEYGEWVEDFLNDNGNGFGKKDAYDIVRQLMMNGMRRVRIETNGYSEAKRRKRSA